MSRKYFTPIVIIIIAVIIIAAGFWFVPKQNNNAVKPESENKTVTFVCTDSKSITATFHLSMSSKTNDTGVDLVLSDGRQLSVPRAMSASGARYANADESFVFWNKGDTAFIQEGQEITYADCVLPADTSS